MKKRNMILWIIIIVPIIFTIPINILLIYYSQDRVEQSKQAIVEDNTAWLRVYAGTIEEQMQQIDNYIKTLQTENFFYQQMSDEAFTKDDPDLFAVQNQLILELRNGVASNNIVSSITAYFEPSDTYLNRDNLGLEKNRVIDAVLTIFDRDNIEQGLRLGNHWDYFEIDNDVYLYASYWTKTSCCIVTISVNELLFNLEWGSDTSDYKYYLSLQGAKLKEYNQPIELLEEQQYDIDSHQIYRDGQQYYNSAVQINGLGLYLVVLISEGNLNQRIPDLTKTLLTVSILTCFVGPIISLIFLFMVEKPLKLLNAGMEEVRKGHVSYRIPIKKNSHNEFDELNMHFNVMLDDLERMKLQLYEQEIDRQKIQLRYLNQQIRPHFILNALNIIYMYGDAEFSVAKKMVIYLTKYFRYLINLNSDYVLLCEEMEHVENYLSIQKMRYPNRFEYFVEWEESLQYTKIPAVVIQTFVENSIKYGFEKGKIMFIFVLAKLTDKGTICITVADTGKGFESEQLEKINEFLKTRKYNENLGSGIQNVVNRLAILYGEDFELNIFNDSDGGAHMTLDIPFALEKDSERD